MGDYTSTTHDSYQLPGNNWRVANCSDHQNGLVGNHASRRQELDYRKKPHYEDGARRKDTELGRFLSPNWRGTSLPMSVSSRTFVMALGLCSAASTGYYRR